MTTTCCSPEIAQAAHIPLIGETAPSFEAHTTQGSISFPKDYSGKWVILFSHPADFTPVCTTEFMTFATMMPEFKALDWFMTFKKLPKNLTAKMRTIWKEKLFTSSLLALERQMSAN